MVLAVLTNDRFAPISLILMCYEKMYFVDHMNIATITSVIENILSNFEVLIEIRTSINVMIDSTTSENISLLPD
jgi:hypothetical protein